MMIIPHHGLLPGGQEQSPQHQRQDQPFRPRPRISTFTGLPMKAKTAAEK